MTSSTVYLLTPEILLVLVATVVYLGGAFLPRRSGWSWLAAAAIVAAGMLLYGQGVGVSAVGPGTEDGGGYNPIAVDQLSYAIRWAVLGAGLLFIMLSARTSMRGEPSEAVGSIVLILAGLNLLALAGDLVLLFVALELISIPTYVLLFLGRGTQVLESGTKYFFLSVLSSALMLYGFSFLYGAAGSTSLADIHTALLAADPDAVGIASFAALALILVFAGLGFRLTAVPFHFYAPDVYQGTTNPNAAILAVVPKVAGLVALVRIATVAMPGLERLGWQLSLALAMITMTLGNVLALWQSNVRRLMAYSSIAHAGYMLIGLAVGFAVAGGANEAYNLDGVGATLFYLLVYSAATVGTFAAVTYLGGARGVMDEVDELAGLARTFPKTAAAIAVFMFSLTGLPPLAGFWGKFMLFTGALGVDARNPDAGSLWPWFVALAIVGALNAAISAAYYLRVVGVMYFRPPESSVAQHGGGIGAAWATAACAVLVIGIGCLPGRLIDEATRASRAAHASLTHPRIVPDTAHSDSPAKRVARSREAAVKLSP